MKELILKAGGQEITVYAEESELAKLIKPERARTGYERVAESEIYYHVGRSRGGACDFYYSFDTSNYTNGDYVNDLNLFKDRERARVLHDRLVQWQALNDEPVDWGDTKIKKWYIEYDYTAQSIIACYTLSVRPVGTLGFSTHEKAQEAIEVFRDELMWYFTKYRLRLDEKRTEAAE